MRKLFSAIVYVMLILSVGLAFYFGNFSKANTAIATQQDACDQEFTYTKTSDFNDSRVNINFESSDEQIDVSADSGYAVIKVELDVENDGHSGYHTYSTGPVNNFNPNPGGDIDSARITVKKVCATATPTVTQTPSATPTTAPTAIPTPTVEPTTEPTAAPTPEDQGGIDCESNPQADICIDCPGQGECEVVIGNPTPTVIPTEEPTATPTPGGQGGTSSNSNSNSSSNSSTGGVSETAATSFANTGMFKEALSNGLLVLGTAISGISFALYGKKKNKIQK